MSQLQTFPVPAPDESQEVAAGRIASEFANTRLPQVLRTTSGVEPYTGAWDEEHALHLLRRTTFGPVRQDISLLMSMPLSQAVDLLLAGPTEEPSFPLNTDSRDLVPVGETWVNAIYRDANSTFTPTGTRISSLKAWWLGLMIRQQLSLREKMVLFWHNHFVTEMDTVNDPRFSYRYLDLIRRNVFGNFKTLARDMSIEGAMLIYLNGNTNTRTSPNENFARELQELFTIGKGPEVAPGDYTNYTEQDVIAAAKVLTGWRTMTNADGTVGPVTWRFDATRHDTNAKQFSERYQNRAIAGRTGDDGARELDDLIDMIFAQPETARYLCRKLYRWFVYYVVDDAAEANVITPMADLLRSSNYEVRPVLSLLLKSAHFHDPVNRGCMIKSPLDHVVGLCRQFGIVFPADVAGDYRMLSYLVGQASAMQEHVGEPPNVAGWPAYYQEPQYYQLWINSDTLPRRTRLTDTLVRSGYTSNGVTIVIDPIAFARTLGNPYDPDPLIEESCRLLYAIPLTAAQRAFLKQTLIPGLPDYEWTVEWGDYMADPTNTQKMTAVKTKLQALFATMLQFPEFQLQ